MSTTAANRFDVASLTPLHWIGIATASITAVIHLALGLLNIGSPMGQSFVVAGVGFLAGIAMVAADYRRRLVYLLGVPFTAGQIVIWYVANAPNFGPLGIADKVVQIVLIVVIVLLYRREPWPDQERRSVADPSRWWLSLSPTMPGTDVPQ